MQRFQVHTNFTGTAKAVYSFTLKELAEEKNLQVLRWALTDPAFTPPPPA